MSRLKLLVGATVLAVVAASASPVMAQGRTEFGPDTALERIITGVMDDEPYLIIPILGVLIGVLAVTLFGLAAIVKSFRGGVPAEDVLARLEDIEAQLREINQHLPGGGEQAIHATAPYESS